MLLKRVGFMKKLVNFVRFNLITHHLTDLPHCGRACEMPNADAVALGSITVDAIKIMV